MDGQLLDGLGRVHLLLDGGHGRGVGAFAEGQAGVLLFPGHALAGRVLQHGAAHGVLILHRAHSAAADGKGNHGQLRHNAFHVCSSCPRKRRMGRHTVWRFT